MNFDRITVNDWLIIGGAIAMIIFGTFIDWITVSFGGMSVSDGNAFDFFFTGAIPWLLVVAAGVIVFLRTQGKIGEQLPWALILVVATALAAVLLLIRFVFNPGVPDGAGRGIGMVVSVIAGIVAAVGAFLAYQAGGGTIAQLADANTYKRAFDTSGDAAPPPPPPPPSDTI